MDDDPARDGDLEAVKAAFLRRWLADRDAGREVSPAEYLAAFGGFEDVVARELSRLEGSARPEDALPAAEAAPSVPEAPPGAPAPPAEEVDGYRLVEVLGEGGMGTVWRAIQERPLEREVALKVVRLGMDTREVVARFETERQALARLDHPGIARVHEATTTRSGRPCFSMELVRGKPITALCDERRLGIPDRLRLFVAVCDAVQHAHEKGIVHRDLKPSNILVEVREGRPAPKVIDFGIAKSLGREPADPDARTEVGQVLGTLDYMSPEQAELGGLAVDTRSDIHSLGVVLYELLAGRLPFDPRELRAGGLTRAVRRLAEVEAPRPSARALALGTDLDAVAAARGTEGRRLVRALRDDLDWIVAKATAKDRDRRYASASELAADVRRHLEHLPVLAGPPGAGYRLRKLLVRHRRSIGAGAWILLVLAAGIWAAVAFARGQEALERKIRSKKLRDDGRLAIGLWESQVRESRDLESRWRERVAGRSGREPVWDLEEDIALWRRWREAAEEPARTFNRAVLSLTQALEAARAGSGDRAAARDLLAELHFRRLEEVYWQGEESLRPEYIAGSILALGAEAYRERLALGGRVRLESDPTGARVHCFRLELVEGRLFPVPFDPASRRAVGGPFLRVERTWTRDAPDASPPPLEPGDRIVALDENPVGLLSELVAAVRAKAPGEAISVDLRRAGRDVRISWTPFSADPAVAGPAAASSAPAAPRLASADELRTRLGVTFEAYPLDLDRDPAGVTSADLPLEIDLPRGSYLLVLRREGRRDARVAVGVPAPPEDPDCRLRARLLGPDDAPPGFVHVPGGWFPCGGDPDVDYPLPAARRRVPDFLMARTEVTFAEWLELVRDLDRQGRLRADGTIDARPRDAPAPGADPEWLEGTPGGAVRVIPSWKGRSLLGRDAAGDWALLQGSGDMPVFGVSALAALEYAAWLTGRHSGRWRFRLPTDLEWEKAARGADRRAHVWGDYPVDSFCRSGRSAGSLAPAGSSPFDESVWGIRDLAGSVSEPTGSRKEGRFLSLRGGSWWATTRYFIRAANRNGRLPEEDYHDQGVRLVAEPADG